MPPLAHPQPVKLYGVPVLIVSGARDPIIPPESAAIPSNTIQAFGLLVFGSFVFLAEYFVRPLLIGSSARLSFIWVLLGIFGGLSAFGLIGLFLGPAILAASIALWRELATPSSA
jgi:predicted PurR-regulated permease PerM